MVEQENNIVIDDFEEANKRVHESYYSAIIAEQTLKNAVKTGKVGINIMFLSKHREDPALSARDIVYTIADKLSDLKGYSAKTIYENLEGESKDLLQKSLVTIPENVTNDFSNNNTEQTTELESKKEDQDISLEEQKEKSIIETINIVEELENKSCLTEFGDFNKILEQPKYKDCINAIVTDPPYAKEHLDLYKKLAKHAVKVLKEGGSLLVMCGQSYLPVLYETFAKEKKLIYHWTIAYLTPGAATQVQHSKIMASWKPILWYTKGDYKGGFVPDTVTSLKASKQHHEWGQSESGIESIIKNYTNEGDIILDPMMGAATTGIVALKNNRKFVGIDINPSTFHIAEERLEKENLA